jgi:hypothetical protein
MKVAPVSAEAIGNEAPNNSDVTGTVTPAPKPTHEKRAELN